jgi:hypothetical protein
MSERSLSNNQYLGPGASITSPNGRYTLTYQIDGNFVLYAPGRQALWNSGTYGRSAGKAIMQTDGNLVVYDGSNRAVWNSGTWGNGGARMALQDDGNLVVYSGSGRALWNSGTYGGRANVQPPQTAMLRDQALSPGGSITSPNGRYTLTYQIDGNFVLYGPGRQALWNTATYGRSAGRAVMQSDGNLVVYDASGRAVWNSGTSGNPGARLALQDDGNLVIYDSGGRALWSSGTYGGRSTIQQPANAPANVLDRMLGNWQSSSYSPVTVRRDSTGYWMGWGKGGMGSLTLEGNTLRVRQTQPPNSNYVGVANVADVSSGRIVWNNAPPRGGYDDTWTKM